MAECENCAAILAALKNPAAVHANMLRGIIAPISMAACAHVHGERMVEWLNKAEAANPPPTQESK